jgi:DNA processing protein
LEDTRAWPLAQNEADTQLEAATRLQAHILSPLDADYPPLLAATPDDPFLIFVRGALAPTPPKSLAVIGTREPTADGEEKRSRDA